MSTFFDRFTKSKGRRMAEDALHLTARAAEQLATANRVAPEEFSPEVAELIAHATKAAAELDEAARRELTDLAEGRE